MPEWIYIILQPGVERVPVIERSRRPEHIGDDHGDESGAGADERHPATPRSELNWMRVMHRLLFPISLGNGYASANSKGLGSHLQSWCSLAEFVFAEINQSDHLAHGSFVKPGGGDIGSGFSLNDIQVQNGVQHIIWWQGILVALIEPQFRRWWFGNARIWYDFFFPINPFRDSVNHCLWYIADDR